MKQRLFAIHLFFIYASAFLLLFFNSCSKDVKKREVISLNGIWEIEQSDSVTEPVKFSHQVSVPGYVDMATPAFDKIGIANQPRKYFWYRKTFKVGKSQIKDIALLKIHKALYGYKVFINNSVVGESFSCFTPTTFDVLNYLKPGKNEIKIRLGAYIDNIPDSMPYGDDREKAFYISGVYDNIELILSKPPYIKNIQVVPLPEKAKVKVIAWVETNALQKVNLKYQITEAVSGKSIAKSKTHSKSINGVDTLVFEQAMPGFKWWSPETPFLYRINVNSSGDNFSTRFGMRSFRFDKESGKAFLNGEKYFMRGTNFCYHRFSEDSLRGNLPWNKDWVNKVYAEMKNCYMNCVRNHQGFPPEMWYNTADEQGILIQDEFPLWCSLRWPSSLSTKVLEKEFSKWLEEHWNHPSIIIWDAQNECWIDSTNRIISQVRQFDFSNRPWDNGYGLPNRETDARESHPYRFHSVFFNHVPFSLEQLEKESGQPDIPVMYTKPNGSLWFRPVFLEGPQPFIVNEYGWLWLNRDGKPTRLTKEVYDLILGPNSTTEQRREAFARHLAALTEFWRCNRKTAAVMHFSFICQSRSGNPVSFTSDNFIDIVNVKLEENFKKYVKDAFCPVGLMIDKWNNRYAAKEKVTIPVVIINDLNKTWEGDLFFDIKNNSNPQLKHISLEPSGSRRITFTVNMPANPGKYLMSTSIAFNGDTISSVRDVYIH